MLFDQVNSWDAAPALQEQQLQGAAGAGRCYQFRSWRLVGGGRRLRGAESARSATPTVTRNWTRRPSRGTAGLKWTHAQQRRPVRPLTSRISQSAKQADSIPNPTQTCG